MYTPTVRRALLFLNVTGRQKREFPVSAFLRFSIPPSLVRRHRRPGVLGPPSSTARRRSPAAADVARAAFGRRRGSPAVARSPTRSLDRSFVRPPSLVRRRSPAVALPPRLLFGVKIKNA